jgi:hypothetical protein
MTDEQLTLHREVFLRLQQLRSSTRKVARTYVANIEREIAGISVALGATRPRRRTGKSVSPEALVRSLDLFDQVRLKPEKGRRKDLKKIEQLVTALQRALAKNA